jgi:hypothetical protein
MPVETIEELSAELQRVGERFAGEGSRLGYFAALYGLMTHRVAEGLAAGRFEHGDRMQRLACHFAARYLSAVERFEAGEPAPAAWQVSFDAASRWRPIVLQHLLLGINAHINFDLGIAAAEVAVAPGGDGGLEAVEHDFNEINAVLAELLGDVQDRLARVSPWMGLLDVVGGRKDEEVGNFSLRKAREAAWQVARRLSTLAEEDRPAAEAALDAHVAHFARVVWLPGFLVTAACIPIRLRERASPAEVIAALSD